jgi:ribosomal protein S18 acetylase RimI-like enzyme
LLKGETVVFVAENLDRNIVGFVAGGAERSGRFPGVSAELYAIYLLPEVRRRGIGTRLVKSWRKN